MDMAFTGVGDADFATDWPTYGVDVCMYGMYSKPLQQRRTTSLEKKYIEKERKALETGRNNDIALSHTISFF